MSIDSVSTSVSQQNISSSYDDTNTRQDDIATWVNHLSLPVELRVPGSGKGVISGYYDDAERLVDDLAILSGLDVKGTRNVSVYTTVNTVADELLGRSYNQFAQYAKLTTTDAQVVHRHLLPIDIDAGQAVAGIMATDEQRLAALAHLSDVIGFLGDCGFPTPMVNDSGNGGHAFYRIDQPNTEDVTAAIKSFLESLHARFPTHRVDRTVFNPSRIMKVPGTMVCKGSEVPRLGLRHRASGILSCPDELVVVPLDMIRTATEAAAAGTKVYSVPEVIEVKPMRDTPVRAAQEYSGGPFDIEAFFDRHDIGYTKQPGTDAQGRTKYTLDHCPFNVDHTGRDAAVFQWPDGKLGFSCFHQSCAEHDWKAVRELFDPADQRQRQASKLDDYLDRFERMFGGDATDDPAVPEIEHHDVGVADNDLSGLFPIEKSAAEVAAGPFLPVIRPVPSTCKLPDNVRPTRIMPASAVMNLRPKRWLVRDILKENETCCTFGPSGTLKSFMMLDIAFCIAAGIPLCGKWPCRQGPVYYGYTEAVEGAHQRLEALLRKYKMTEVPADLYISPDKLELAGEAGAAPLIAGIWQAMPTPPVLVVIDTLSANFGGGDENSTDMAVAVAAMTQVRNTFHCAVNCVHHTGKDINRKERGSSSLGANIDARLEMSRDRNNNIVTLCNLKAKDHSDEGEWQFRPRVHELWTEQDDVMGPQKITSLTLETVSAEEADELATEERCRDQLAILLPLTSGPLGMTDLRTASKLDRAKMEQLTAEMLGGQTPPITREPGRKGKFAITEQGQLYVKCHG